MLTSTHPQFKNLRTIILFTNKDQDKQNIGYKVTLPFPLPFELAQRRHSTIRRASPLRFQFEPTTFHFLFSIKGQPSSCGGHFDLYPTSSLFRSFGKRRDVTIWKKPRASGAAALPPPSPSPGLDAAPLGPTLPTCVCILALCTFVKGVSYFAGSVGVW